MADPNDPFPKPTGDPPPEDWPPGGWPPDPGPAGPDEKQQAALERIAEALEGVRSELAELRRLLDRSASGR